MAAFGVLLGGAAQGSAYALVVLGFVLIWSVTGIVNLAQGAVAVAGAYTAWQLRTVLGMPALPAIVVTAMLIMAVGYATGYFTAHILRARQSFVALVITFGVGLSLQGLLTLRYGAEYRILPPLLAGTGLTGTAAANLTSLIVVAGCGACCAAGIMLWRGRLGQVMAVVGADRETARTLGILPQHIEALAAGLGTAYAATGGGLAGLTGVFRPADASRFTLACAVVVIVVGARRPVRAAATAVLLGIADALARYLFGNTEAVVAGVVVLLAVLIARGAGVLPDDDVRDAPAELTP